MEQTIFHKVLSGEVPCHKVYESDAVLAFLDIMPCAVGHTLVISKTVDGANMMDTSPGSLAEVFEAAHRLAPMIARAVGADGFNVIMNNGAAAGQVVMYPHVHIIPRREGDGLKHWPKIERTQEQLAQDAVQIKNTVKAI